MSHRGRHSADELLAAALAGGKTVRDAALTAGVSEKTAHRRNAEVAFRSRVRDLRAGMIGAAAGALADGMSDAAGTLRALVADPDPNVRLRAAVKVLELGLKVVELGDLELRVREMEEQLANPVGKGAA